MLSEVGLKLYDMHDTDIPDRDQEWRQDRRHYLEQYNNIERKNELERDSREQAFARTVMQVLQKANDRVCEAAVVSDFTTRFESSSRFGKDSGFEPRGCIGIGGGPAARCLRQ